MCRYICYVSLIYITQSFHCVVFEKYMNTKDVCHDALCSICIITRSNVANVVRLEITDIFLFSGELFFKIAVDYSKDPANWTQRGTVLYFLSVTI